MTGGKPSRIPAETKDLSCLFLKEERQNVQRQEAEREREREVERERDQIERQSDIMRAKRNVAVERV